MVIVVMVMVIVVMVMVIVVMVIVASVMVTDAVCVTDCRACVTDCRSRNNHSPTKDTTTIVSIFCFSFSSPPLFLTPLNGGLHLLNHKIVL